MNIVVTDANILIDMCELGMLDAFFALPYDIHVVESVWDELVEKQQLLYKTFINNGKLSVVEQTEIDLFEVNKIKQTKNQLSIPDCSSLVYAKSTNGILLTGDKNLRTTAKAKDVEVKGHLWVLDEMVKVNAISPDKAIDKLNELRTTINPKLGLPPNDCDMKIKTWSGQL